MPNPSPSVYAGVDVGGTNIKIGLVGDGAETLAFDSNPTHQEEGAEAASLRASATLDLLLGEAGLTKADIAMLGLVTPGPLDLQTGSVLAPGNLPAWRNAPVRQLFGDATGLPVAFANDANAAAYGEFWAGAGRMYDTMVLLTLGTGVGGGVVLHDQMIEGAHSCGGELGHIIIDASDDAPLNSLGIRGTLEGYCGSYGVVGRAQAALSDAFVETSLRDSVSGGEKLTPLLVANAAEAGDEVATKVVMETARYLAMGVVTCAHAIDPDAVLIGGAMTFGGAGHPLGERFMAEIRRHAHERMIESLRDQIVIDFAELGGKAGYIGAAGLARRAFKSAAAKDN
ncbi:Glucokinase [Pseudobythopirellula maris]|uniref:Glucokinase n=1 Tax=Pseudobythopirellula maris TaxID=2527991 RepID=A0A5C5ZPD9_9BACT|nr:ROK family protein [Pseudobythopirellula maris]TWT88253.1 Glucokinase [Pseudobythopirellula maris]